MFAHTRNQLMLLAGILAGSFCVLAAQSAGPATKAPAPPFRFQPNRLPMRAAMYYQSIWGIDSPSVKLAESGVIARFSWHVLDPNKAKELADKSLEPALIDLQAGVKLSVPDLPFVGKMRQSSMPIAGKMYWMAFSNKGHFVKRGDRVDVVVGKFRASGLVVQ